MSVFLNLKVKSLWAWFEKHLAEFDELSGDNPVYEKFHKELSSIHPSLVFEISAREESGVRTLVISCDGIRGGISSVEALVAKAPTIEGWKIIAFRPSIDQSITIEGDGLKLSTDDILFDYQTAPNDTVDITLYIDGINDNNKSDYLSAAFVLLDAAVGEYRAMTKIGGLDLLPTPSNRKALYPLRDLSGILS